MFQVQIPLEQMCRGGEEVLHGPEDVRQLSLTIPSNQFVDSPVIAGGSTPVGHVITVQLKPPEWRRPVSRRPPITVLVYVRYVDYVHRMLEIVDITVLVTTVRDTH